MKLIFNYFGLLMGSLVLNNLLIVLIIFGDHNKKFNR